MNGFDVNGECHGSRRKIFKYLCLESKVKPGRDPDFHYASTNSLNLANRMSSSSRLPPLGSEHIFSVSSSSLIDAPREKVWEIMLDFESYKEWQVSISFFAVIHANRFPRNTFVYGTTVFCSFSKRVTKPKLIQAFNDIDYPLWTTSGGPNTCRRQARRHTRQHAAQAWRTRMVR